MKASLVLTFLICFWNKCSLTLCNTDARLRDRIMGPCQICSFLVIAMAGGSDLTSLWKYWDVRSLYIKPKTYSDHAAKCISSQAKDWWQYQLSCNLSQNTRHFWNKTACNCMYYL